MGLERDAFLEVNLGGGAGGVSGIGRGKGKRKYIVGSGNRQHQQGLGIQCNNHFLRASLGQISPFPEDVLKYHLGASPATSFKRKLAGSRGHDVGCSLFQGREPLQ